MILFTTIQTVRSYNSTCVQASKLIRANDTTVIYNIDEYGHA